MVDPGNGPDEAALAIAARHALHDEELVAAFATGNLDDASELAKAQQLVDRCTVCRDVHRDLATIGEALRGSAQFTASAPRDFRLSVEDAMRLGGTVSARGFLARLRNTLAGVARPLGASMTALGVVGLLVGSATLGGPAAAPLQVDSTAIGESAAPELNPGAAQASRPGSTARNALDPGATFEEGGAGGHPYGSDGDAGPSPSTLLLGGSIGLLAGGLLLLALTLRRGREQRARA